MYKERQKTYLIVVSIYIIVAVFLLSLIFLPQFFNLQKASLFVKVVLIIITVADLTLFWSFAELRIKLTGQFLQIGFGVFKKRIPLDQIKDCFAEDYSKENFFGYGIRLGKDKSIGYIARAGRGLRLKTSGRDIYVSSENPEQLCNEIKKIKIKK